MRSGINFWVVVQSFAVLNYLHQSLISIPNKFLFNIIDANLCVISI